MRCQLLVVGCLVLLGTSAATASERSQARLVKIADAAPTTIRATGEFRPLPTQAAADTCVVRHDQGIYWKIDGWVVGAELYKGYCDPAAACGGTYPFTVTEINMPMYFGGTPTFAASVDVELADYTTPSCPVPGVLVAISSEYELSVPGAGLYDIWIPLDTPVVVNGPFFAGFYISTVLAETDLAAVVIDTVPTQCVSYNIWDTTVGFVDLANNEFYNFPGRLVLYAKGIPSDAQPAPAVDLVWPRSGDTLLGRTEIWVKDSSGSSIVDYAVFEYRPAGGGAYVEIGQDFDPHRPLRDGSSGMMYGNGLAYSFTFSGLTEGEYWLRGSVHDTLGRVDRDSVKVFIEPTPPVPSVISIADGDGFCSPVTFDAVCPDENVEFVQLFSRPAQDEYSAGVYVAGPMSRGNHWNAPYAAAIALELWYDRGYQKPMKDGVITMPVDTVAARLAYWFRTLDNSGTYDEDIVTGLYYYLYTKGNEFRVDVERTPTYFQIRDWVENRERSVMLGLSGTPGTWMTVDGFSGWLQLDGSYVVRVSDPLTGVVIAANLRNNLGVPELFYNGGWHPIDIMIGLAPKGWSPARVARGADFDGSNGWSISWVPSGLTEDGLYHFDVTGRDVVGFRGTQTLLLQYDCSSVYRKGDYNNSGGTDIVDADYLLRFVVQGGSAPIGGAGRADANCDGYVNFADVVYFMNYLFGGTTEPCY